MIKEVKGINLLTLAAVSSKSNTINGDTDGLSTRITNTEDNIENLSNLINQLETYKEDKPTITKITDKSISVILDDNKIMQCDEVTALTISAPVETLNSGCILDISFTSGDNPTNVTMPDVELCSGSDCVDNIFTPIANTRYNAVFWYDGKYVVGAIQGNIL